MSPLIFSLVIDWVLKTTVKQPRGIKWTHMQKLEDLDFTDDVSLLYTHGGGVCRLKLRDCTIFPGCRADLEIKVTKTKNM